MDKDCRNCKHKINYGGLFGGVFVHCSKKGYHTKKSIYEICDNFLMWNIDINKRIIEIDECIECKWCEEVAQHYDHTVIYCLDDDAIYSYNKEMGELFPKECKLERVKK